MSVRNTFPQQRPTLNLDFANSKTLDPRITFTRASTGTYVGSDGLIKTAAADEARFDHDPTTGESLGLLIEEQRTNLMPYSSNTTIYSSANVTTSRTTGFDGNPTSGFNVVYNSNNASFVLTSTAAVTSGNTYTFSVYIKKNVNSTSGNQGIVMYSYFDNGTAGQWSGSILNEDGKNLSQAPVGVWKRYSKTITVTSGTGVQIILPGYDTSGLDVTYYNSQIELGAFPTSAIPTSGSAVTRQPDIASITGTNFTDFFNSSEGTFYAHYTSTQPTNARIINFGTVPESTIISNEGVIGSGLYYSYIGAIGTSALDGVKVAATTSISESAGSFDGNTAVSTGACSYYAGATSLNFIPGVAPIKQNWIKQLIYYPERLTDTQLQALTQ